MLGCLGLLGCSGGRQTLRHCAFTVNPHRPVASFPGPAQLFVTCSMESGEAWYLFSHEDDVINKWPKISEFNEL